MLHTRLFVALCLVLLRAPVSDACMASTRMSRWYVPSVSLNWWRSNVTAINQTRPPDFKMPNSRNNTTTPTLNVNGINGAPERNDGQPQSSVPLLPIRVERDPHRPEYYRVVSSSEIPMPKPLFVIPYSPSPAFTPPSTEDPRVLWNNILTPRTPSNRQIDLPASTPWWTSIKVSSDPDPHVAEPSNRHETKVVSVPMFTRLPDSGLHLADVAATNNDSISIDQKQVSNITNDTEAVHINDTKDATDLEKDTLDEIADRIVDSHEPSQDDSSTSGGIDSPDEVTTQSILTTILTDKVVSRLDTSLSTTVSIPDTVTTVSTPIKSLRSKRPQAIRNTGRSESLSSIIQTMPVNSVIVVVGDEKQQQDLVVESPADLQTQESTILHPTLTTLLHGTAEEQHVTTEIPLYPETANEKQLINDSTQAVSSEIMAPSNFQQLTGQQAIPETVSEAAARDPEMSVSLTDAIVVDLKGELTSSNPLQGNESTMSLKLSLNQSVQHSNDATELPTKRSGDINMEVVDSFTVEPPQSITPSRESTPSDVTLTEQTLSQSTAVDTSAVTLETRNVGADANDSNLAPPQLSVTDVNPVTLMISDADVIGNNATTTSEAESVDSTSTEFSTSAMLTTEPSISPVDLNESSLIDAFQGSVISASTENPLDAIIVSEATFTNGTERLRLVSEEQVLVERIPHSVPPGEDRHSALQGDSIISSVLEIINASSHTEKPKGVFSFSPTLAAILNHARVRKQSNDVPDHEEVATADVDGAGWLAEGVLLPNGSSVIVPKQGVRGVPHLLPLPPPPEGITVNMRNIHMRRKRLRDGKRIVVATLHQQKDEVGDSNNNNNNDNTNAKDARASGEHKKGSLSGKEPAPLVYYYWKQARSRHFSLLSDGPARVSSSNSYYQ